MARAETSVRLSYFLSFPVRSTEVRLCSAAFIFVSLAGQLFYMRQQTVLLGKIAEAIQQLQPQQSQQPQQPQQQEVVMCLAEGWAGEHVPIIPAFSCLKLKIIPAFTYVPGPSENASAWSPALGAVCCTGRLGPRSSAFVSRFPFSSRFA